jgi:Cellulase (glycosyl hydrolase family 5)
MRSLPATRATRLAAAVLLALAASLCPAPTAGATAARATSESALLRQTSAERTRYVAEVATQLGAKYLRVDVEWRRAEPQPAVYDEVYLQGLDEVVTLAQTYGLRVVLDFYYPPAWASDESLWSRPPAGLGYTPGAYAPIYAPREDAAVHFGAFITALATRPALNGKIFAYEPWNEPNLWLYLYPQAKTAGDDFALRRYAGLLRACHDALQAADPLALVLGGATAPIGENNATRLSPYRTSPLYWARTLRSMRLGPYMDAYSHHPYVPGGTKDMRPEAPPRDASTTVQLGNIDDLLAVFPGKAFYLTEFGYNTSYSQMFGGSAVTQAQQADYLRRAYRFASRFSRVKALFWYLRRDWSPTGTYASRKGVYTGLRTLGEGRKRSWFAFAGGNRLTLTARSPIAAGGYTRMTGALTCSRLATATTTGGLANKALEIQVRRDGVWTTIRGVATRSGGKYVAAVSLRRDARLRVIWRGVVISPSRFVDVR